MKLPTFYPLRKVKDSPHFLFPEGHHIIFESGIHRISCIHLPDLLDCDWELMVDGDRHNCSQVEAEVVLQTFAMLCLEELDRSVE